MILLCMVLSIVIHEHQVKSENYRQPENFGRIGQGAEKNYLLDDNAPVRTYYIAAVEKEWDYAPLKENTLNNDLSTAKKLIFNGGRQIGSRYTKVIYTQFTDGTYTREIPAPKYNGFLGPTLKGTVGEKIRIHFKNMASRPYTMHPETNVWYNDDSEGALYDDNTPTSQKFDDQVQPGESWTYNWELRANFGPTGDDENCIGVPYSSHNKPPKDRDTGLVGMMVVCKPGVLRHDGSRVDVDREYVLFMGAVNESFSWLIDENVNRCRNPAECNSLVKSGNKDFIESTIYQQINGYIYGNGPDFEVCSGEKVVFYAFGINTGIQTVTIYGGIQSWLNRRFEGVSIQPGIAKVITVNPEGTGRWLMGNTNLHNFQNGMFAFVKVNQCPWIKPLTTIPSGKIVRFYLAAEDIITSPTPNGILARAGHLTKERAIREQQSINAGKIHHGRFIQYTDETFTTPVAKTAETEHFADFGPHVYAEVGDILEVVLKNKLKNRKASFVPVGIDIDKKFEGILYRNNRESKKLCGRLAMPGETKLYRFVIRDNVSPNPKLGLRCFSSFYHSAGEGYVEDVNFRLTGPMTICKRGGLYWNGKQVGYDKQFFLQASVYNPKESLRNPYEGMYPAYRPTTITRFPSINGLQYGNVKGLEMCAGETVLLSILGFAGDEDRYQSIIFEGNSVKYSGQNVDAISIGNGISATVIMTPDNIGVWLIKSGQTNLQEDGMIAKYIVRDCGRKSYIPKSISSGGKLWRYFIAAVGVEWEYIERKIHPVTLGDMRDPNTDGHLYVRDTMKFIGTKYAKAVYREFTDGSFKHLVKRSFRDYHLGILGPFVRVEVGDTLEIVYKNMVNFPNTINMRNLKGDNHMVRDQAENGVPPGKTTTFRWYVPERSGPGPFDPNCVGRSYDSTTNPLKDSNTGLFGPLIVCRKGVLDKNGNRNDNVDREFAVNFEKYDETKSHFFKLNTRLYAPGRKDCNDPVFVESNQMRAINGFMYFNTPALNISVGEQVSWYIMSTGDKSSQHSIKFHGQALTMNVFGKTKRTSVISSEAGTYYTAEMLADHASLWLMSNHVGENMFKGSMARYTITEDPVP
ncbi:HEPH [Mytilus coruscus]|uniref:HEPH n=1 Tax=Mytilus coruscus TaxID=42192 RepID=A0A6J8DTE8_MYTCO|nr:HEPH [Mytilus coruscus]